MNESEVESKNIKSWYKNHQQQLISASLLLIFGTAVNYEESDKNMENNHAVSTLKYFLCQIFLSV